MLLFKSVPTQFNYKKSTSFPHAKVRCRVASTAFFDDDEDELRSRHKKKKSNEEHTLQVKKLNQLFYMDYKLTQPELEDLIMGTFKRFYKITLETRHFQECLVIYPEIKHKQDFDYIKELMNIAETLSDYGMKQFVVNKFKNLQMKKDPIIIPLPIHPLINRDM